jgi:hypothetical protein
MAYNANGQYYYDPYLDAGANPNDPFLHALAPSPGIAYDNSRDPRAVSQNQRAIIQQGGDRLQQQNQIIADQQGQQYQNRTNFLDPITQEMAAGHGGYTPDEIAQIMQSGGQQNNFLTPDEQAGIRGDTSQWGRYFNPDQMNSNLSDYQRGASNAADALQGGLNDAINPNALVQSSDYLSRSNGTLNNNNNQFLNILNAQGNNVRGALDTTESGVGGAQSAEAGNVRGAIDPGALRQSQEAANIEVMTPEQEQEMVTGAGISAGVRNDAAVGDLKRAALAAGASPEGVAAYRARMNRENAGEAADAMTKARVAAQQTRSQEQFLAEAQREAAEQYLTGTKVGAEENLGAQDVGSRLALGNMRSQAEQNMGGEALSGQLHLGDTALQQANIQEQNRQAAQQYLTNAQLQAATTGGQARLGVAEANVGQQQQQGQYNATTGTGLAAGQEAANAARAGQVAANRQNTEQTNQANQSARATQVGNTRLNAQQTGLGVQSGLAGTANANQQNAYNRQGQNYAVQTSGTNQAAGIGLQASQTPSTLDKVVGGIAGGISAAVPFLSEGDVVGDEPKLAVVGDDGPEKITPMDGYRATRGTMHQGFQQKEVMRKKRPMYGEAA